MSTLYDIETRKGLPEHLRVLADKYPRAVWQGHGNFNELTSFWLERHLMFRRVIEKLIADTEVQLDTNKPRYEAELSRYTGFFLDQLHQHHTIEDTHYFPKFNQFDGRLVRAFDMLDKDHHALDAHLAGLAEHTNAVLTGSKNNRDARDATGRLLAVQTGFRRFLDRHLQDEEEIIVPIVLEYGAEID